MKAVFIRIHSGFANIPDSVVILPPDQDRFPTDATTDVYSCDLPDGFEFSEDATGGTKLYYHKNEVWADVQDKGKTTHIYLYDETSQRVIYKTIV